MNSIAKQFPMLAVLFDHFVYCFFVSTMLSSRTRLHYIPSRRPTYMKQSTSKDREMQV